jgi:outer membrane protein assembly factor BamB
MLATAVLVGSTLIAWAGSGSPSAAGAAAPAVDQNGWTIYHGDAAGSGVAQSVTAVDTSAAAWTSPALDGQLYGEPLVSSGRVYVATENDTVYALSASTGSVLWSRHLASPVPAGSLPCGDITPTVGITGTPVIDAARHEIFVVADELVDGRPAHLLEGLDTTSGAVVMSQDVDPAGADPAALLQRTGLTLSAGQVVFAMGGNYGDCAAYRGRVVAVNEAGGAPTYFTVDAAAGDSQGAIWMGGAAPTVDASGNIWVGVGNGSVHAAGRPYDDSDSALELSSSLTLLQYFAPTSWPEDNADDLDMSIAPALLPDGQVVLAGKARIVYLLDGAHLGGVGGQVATLPSACPEDIDGGTAVVGTTVYLPCVSSLVAVQATPSPPALHVLWRSSVAGGPPIVAAGLVWTISQRGTLYGLNPSTGAVRQQATVGAAANHFPTPSVGDGLLLAPAANRVVAFAATAASPSSTTTTSNPAINPTTQPQGGVPTTHPLSLGHAGGGNGVSAGLVIGLVAAGLVVLAGLGWFLRRRWRPRRRPDGAP